MSDLKWKPISTAPKDGTTVIVGFDIADTWIVLSASYLSKEEVNRLNKHGCDVDLEDVGWWSYKNSVTQEQLDGIYEPTHWLVEVSGVPGREL